MVPVFKGLCEFVAVKFINNVLILADHLQIFLVNNSNGLVAALKGELELVASFQFLNFRVDSGVDSVEL